MVAFPLPVILTESILLSYSSKTVIVIVSGPIKLRNFSIFPFIIVSVYSMKNFILFRSLEEISTVSSLEPSPDKRLNKGSLIFIPLTDNSSSSLITQVTVKGYCCSVLVGTSFSGSFEAYNIIPIAAIINITTPAIAIILSLFFKFIGFTFPAI